MYIDVKYYQRFHICFLSVAVVLVTIVQVTTAYEQQHGTDTNFHQGSFIGEVNV